jgi:hypothetical protein
MFRDMRKLGLFVLLLTTLTGCETPPTVPYDKKTFAQRIGSDLAIAPETILHQGNCNYGRAIPGLPDADFYPCLYIDTATWAALLDYDKTSNKYVEVIHINFSETPGVALPSDGQQLQIKSKQSYLVINMNRGSGLVPRDLYNHMVAAGVPAVDTIGYVKERFKNVAPGPVVIPIYLPPMR